MRQPPATSGYHGIENCDQVGRDVVMPLMARGIDGILDRLLQECGITALHEHLDLSFGFPVIDAARSENARVANGCSAAMLHRTG